MCPKRTDSSKRASKKPDKARTEKKMPGALAAVIKMIAATLFVCNLTLSLVMIISAYSGFFEPDEHPLVAVCGLAFTPLLYCNLLLLVLWMVCRRWRYAIVSALPLIICAQQVYTTLPLGMFFPRFGSDRDGARFSLMTYNVLQWEDFANSCAEENPTVTEILKVDADIVALQECYSLDANSTTHFTPEQVDSLRHRYPYRVVSSRDLALLSKFPIIESSNLSGMDTDYAVSRHRVTNECGDTITIFNVHLQSFGLTDDDKSAYRSTVSREIIHEDMDSIKDTFRYLRHYVYPKLARANTKRAEQARAIAALLKKENGRTILCGDFNDTSTSFAYRKIKGKMHDLHTDCGFGPTITFHANRLYFKIDQIFYTGRLLPIDISRPAPKCSDHYPLVAVFESFQ